MSCLAPADVSDMQCQPLLACVVNSHLGYEVIDGIPTVHACPA